MIQTLKKDMAEVLSTAWPMMLSTGLFSITLFVDRMLLYRYSEGSAAAAMAAGTLFWALTCLPSGVCGYTNAFVAQYLAAKRPERAMRVVWQGLLLGIAVAPLLIVFGMLSHRFFLWSGHLPSMALAESQYFCWLVPGACASVAASALVGLYQGSGRTRVLVISDVIATLINIVLDLALIFGMWGFPEMGTAGAALASSVSLIFKFLILIVYALPDFRTAMVRHRDPATGNLKVEHSLRKNSHGEPVQLETLYDSSLAQNGSVFDWSLMRRLIHFGWPAGMSVVAEAWSFTAIMMIVGKLGERPAAATTLALGVNLLAFIPLVGLGIAVGVLVGKYLVLEDRDRAKRMVRSGLVIGVMYSLFFVVFYGGFPDFAMDLYSFDVAPERFAEMRPILRPLLYFIAGYCIFDAFQTVFVGALKGAGDTYFVLLGHLFAGSLTVVGGITISRVWKWDGLYYWWGVITFWVILLAVIFSLRYLQGGWQEKRVIEPIVID
jgi:MATE family multidrug resistance protein